MSKFNITAKNIGFIGNGNVVINNEKAGVRVIRKMIDTGKIDIEILDMVADNLNNEQLRDKNITVEKLKVIIQTL